MKLTQLCVLLSALVGFSQGGRPMSTRGIFTHTRPSSGLSTNDKGASQGSQPTDCYWSECVDMAAQDSVSLPQLCTKGGHATYPDACAGGSLQRVRCCKPSTKSFKGKSGKGSTKSTSRNRKHSQKSGSKGKGGEHAGKSKNEKGTRGFFPY